MAQYRYSILLDRLLGDSLKYGSPSFISRATAEKFIIAVIDQINAQGNRLSGELFDCVVIFQRLNVNLNSLRNDLFTYVNNNADRDVDIMYLSDMIDSAWNKVRAQNIHELGANGLLYCILDNPSETVRSCFLRNMNSSANTGETVNTSSNGEFKKNNSSGAENVAGIINDVNVTVNDPKNKDGEENGKKKTESQSKKTKKASDGTPASFTEKAKEIEQALSSCIFGQDNAINTFASGYFRAQMLELTDKNRSRPRATYLFAGPPGVGKTFLAEKAAEILDLPFMRFDMSEYVDDESNIEFCGSDKVYKNGKPGNLTGFVEQNPKCVLLFDEIEKAHISIIHLFLQLLDAGRLRDNYTDTEVSFTDAIIIFTTNAAKQLYENSESTDLSTISRKVIIKALQTDINPTTKKPYFPAAICSRFASGNVVMFNHISAAGLRQIAKRELDRHVKNLYESTGIKVDIDEKVYTAILFAEGGSADARTVRARAEAFFDNELYELFRLTASDSVRSTIDDIKTISIDIQLPQNDAEIYSLFTTKDKPRVLVFASEDVLRKCQDGTASCTFVGASERDEAIAALKETEYDFIYLDFMYKSDAETADYLNIEDVDSQARSLFSYIREYYSHIPVYILADGRTIGREERTSFARLGVRDVVDVDEDLGEKIEMICMELHSQRSMNVLARSNKVVSFETAQFLLGEGKSAKIRLFDFKLSVAMDAEDSENILDNVSRPSVTFDDVIGADDAKQELKYFAEYLRDPKKYAGTGVRAPKGVLLYGPPGTGKTLLAKAMAGEADATFITAEGNQFLKKYVGEGSEYVHKLFNRARKYAPTILFIDEIDAIGKERKGGDYSDGAERTLTAFLAEMDGFKNDPTKPVFVLAATNYEVESGRAKSLDGALVRRFDRKVYIDLPGKDGRLRFIRMKIAKNKAFALSEEMINNLALRSTGMSLASLDSVFELALRSVIRTGQTSVTDEVIDDAFETFNSGEKKPWDASLLLRVARHESGHAFICWYNGETPSYVTVVARSGYGGYMQHGDNEGKYLSTKDEMLARICTSLGGRAAEIVYYGERDGVTTGAGGDLSNATATAQRMICKYGMDENFGLASIDVNSAYSGTLADDVRAAVNDILDCQMQRAVELIELNKDAIDAFVSALMEKNHLTSDEIDTIFGKYVKRP